MIHRRGLITLLLPCALLYAGCTARLPRPLTDPYLPDPLPWGYSMEYPLPMASILDSLDYLDRLRTPEGQPVPYRRLGAVKRRLTLATEPTPPPGLLDRLRNALGLTPTPGHILDHYELQLPSGTKILWLDPYAGHTTSEPPTGLRLAP